MSSQHSRAQSSRIGARLTRQDAPVSVVAQVHVAGGYNNEDGMLDSAEFFDGERWTEVPVSATMRTGAGAFVIDKTTTTMWM